MMVLCSSLRLRIGIKKLLAMLEASLQVSETGTETSGTVVLVRDACSVWYWYQWDYSVGTSMCPCVHLGTWIHTQIISSWAFSPASMRLPWKCLLLVQVCLKDFLSYFHRRRTVLPAWHEDFRRKPIWNDLLYIILPNKFCKCTSSNMSFVILHYWKYYFMIFT